jgi:hypothetical protein
MLPWALRALVLCAGFLLAPGAAAAAGPLGLTSCGPAQGVYQCSGLVTTWDGVPLDTTVTLPAAGASGLPLVADLHGFGNSKYEYLDPGSTAYTDNAFDWARDGYAVLTYTSRGLWGSCGTPESRAASPTACARGYIHLADVRYEARDTQELIGRLVDEGVADSRRIGVTGDSYGGGQSFELAALRDRTMLPDGRLVPWRSPKGTPLSLTAAAPVIPWTDLVYAIAPNGRTSANSVPPPGADTNPVGVFKASFANAILAAAQNAIGPGQPVGEPFVPGRPMGYLAPPGTDPDADVQSDVARADRGEPYDDDSGRRVIERQERYRSAYSIDTSHAPPPLFVGSGFTDDLFPVDEALRFANRTRRDYPRTPIRLLFGDFGHQRSSNKPLDRKLLLQEVHAWIDHYVRGGGTTPATGITAVAETCPRSAPSGGVYKAPTFAALAKGEVRFTSNAAQTLDSHGGNPQVGAALDPAAGGGDACVTTSSDPEPGTATYMLPAATGAGYTLLGAARVSAKLTVSGTPPTSAQVAARLWDVAPGGAGQTLVARGLYRPSGAASDSFELHPNGWHFARGHAAKLELLGADAPYARPSNGSFTIAVRQLDLRLPTAEGSAGGASGSCLARRSRIGARNIGRIRLGYTRRRLLRRVAVAPRRRHSRSYVYCVKGGHGRVVAVFSSRSRRGRVELVTTTAPRHGNRGVRVGSRAARFRSAYPRRRRIASGVFRAGPRSSRMVVVRKGRVRLLGVASRRLLRHHIRLRRELRLALR